MNVVKGWLVSVVPLAVGGWLTAASLVAQTSAAPADAPPTNSAPTSVVRRVASPPPLPPRVSQPAASAAFRASNSAAASRRVLVQQPAAGVAPGIAPSGGTVIRLQPGPSAQSSLSPVISPFTPPAPEPPPLTSGLPGLNLTPPPGSALSPSPILSPAVSSPAIQLSPVVQTPADPNALKWDAELKTHQAAAGEAMAQFTFWLTNVSSADILVNRVSTSCGCTVAQLPSQPWRIPPGGDGPIRVTMSLIGKSGLISKGVTVETSVGIKQLTVRTEIPPGSTPTSVGLPVVASGTMNDKERLQNMQMALADRQVLFKNQDCAKCHADPAHGKIDGREVYAAVCATCHNSHLRAAMVPDLRTLSHPTDADFWRNWITYGRAGSMMPAFAKSEGGPLDDLQVDALVGFMTRAFPSRMAAAQGSPATSASPVSSVSPAGLRPTAQVSSQAGPGVRTGPALHP